jgi:hypothetical protein
MQGRNRDGVSCSLNPCVMLWEGRWEPPDLKRSQRATISPDEDARATPRAR